MKMKRIFALILAIALMATVFVGCGGSSSDDSKKDSGSASDSSALPELENGAKLKLWGPNASVNLMKKQAAAFEKEHADKNIKIEVVAQEEGDAATVLGNDPAAAADVFGFPSDQLSTLVNAGNLNPVQMAYVQNLEDNHTKGAVDAARGEIEGTEVLYAYPETDNGYYLVYDKSVVSDEDAKTLEGVLAACEKAGKKFIMNAGDGYFACMFPFTGGLRLAGLGGEANDEQKFNDYNTDEVVDTLEAFAKLFHDYKGTMVSDDVAKIASGFAAEPKTVAAGIDGTWNASVDKEKLGDNYGVVKLPTINVNGEDKEIVAMVGYKYIGVNAHSDYPVAAQALANYLSSTECQQQRLDELGWTPTDKNVKFEDNPAIEAMQAQGETFVVQANIITQFWSPMGALGNQLCKEDGKYDKATLKKAFESAIANING